MAGILKVDQIQNTAGVNIMDLQNDEIRVWNGSGYSSMATLGALISIKTFTSQNGTWAIDQPLVDQELGLNQMVVVMFLYMSLRWWRLSKM